MDAEDRRLRGVGERERPHRSRPGGRHERQRSCRVGAADARRSAQDRDRLIVADEACVRDAIRARGLLVAGGDDVSPVEAFQRRGGRRDRHVHRSGLIVLHGHAWNAEDDRGGIRVERRRERVRAGAGGRLVTERVCHRLPGAGEARDRDGVLLGTGLTLAERELPRRDARVRRDGGRDIEHARTLAMHAVEPIALVGRSVVWCRGVHEDVSHVRGSELAKALRARLQKERHGPGDVR